MNPGDLIQSRFWIKQPRSALSRADGKPPAGYCVNCRARTIASSNAEIT
jgi:hypothetical protein